MSERHHFLLADNIMNKLMPITKEPRLMISAVKEMDKGIKDMLRREPKNADLIEEQCILKQIINHHERAVMEFPRKELLVMADNNFRLNVLRKEDLQEQLNRISRRS